MATGQSRGMHYPRSGMFVYASTGEILKSAQISMDEAEKVEVNSGEIVKIERNGQITRAWFDDTKLRPNLWRAPAAAACCYPLPYLDELKERAAWMGYPPELIAHYANRGFTPQEIEELLIDGEI